jgi:hypothetical protein
MIHSQLEQVFHCGEGEKATIGKAGDGVAMTDNPPQRMGIISLIGLGTLRL